MKLIHCADIHLDSKMTSNLDKAKAKERKFEILGTFLRMIDYAEDNGVSGIIIAGDLFDTTTITATTRNSVIDAITSHEDIAFYYIRGNHGGSERFLEAIPEIPDNLFLFDRNWKQYKLSTLGDRNVTISGIEPDGSDTGALYSSLILDPRDFNIVTMHGQISAYKNENDAETISLNELRNRNIDYLALGHVHEYQEGELPPRGKYCYCGCLEGRGFDECGEHGFVLIDVNENDQTYRTEFIPFAKRNLHEVHADISGCRTTPEIRHCMDEAIERQNCDAKDMIKVILEGEIDVDCEKNTDYLGRVLTDSFYFGKIQDKTKIRIDYNDYALDASLKGEFVRIVQGDENLDEEEKALIIRCGFQAFDKEDFEL
ncbi:MAG: metallophosphoesterase [Lachnospiraceae bacterium]|nr:metallophosphoesterase [Lachnospiraceae bacterium]